MEEVNNLHRQREPPSTRTLLITCAFATQDDGPGQQDEEQYQQTSSVAFDLDPFSSTNDPSNPSFFDDDYETSSDIGFDLNSDVENPGRNYDDDRRRRRNLALEMYEPRQCYAGDFMVWDMDSSETDEPDNEFDFGPAIGSGMGLRATDIDSESDSEVNLGLGNTDDDSYDAFGVSNDNYHAGDNEREESEWEEVSERIPFDERDNLNLVINGIGEISVSSNVSSSDGEYSSLEDEEGTEGEINLEWEILMERNSVDVIRHFNLPDDYIFTTDDDAILGQLTEMESALMGSPPAAKSVVDNLPSVVLTHEEMGEKNNNNGIVCAICKDEFAAGDKGTKLPCCHLYHGDCIVPWLRIRNTCPVCRYKLPTDDADYERRSEGVGDEDDLLMILR